MKFSWDEVQDLIEEAGLTGREVSAIRYRLGLPRLPDAVYLTFNPVRRRRLISKAMLKLRIAREKRDG